MIKNAKIESTKLGLDRGVFLSFWLMLDYGGSGQGFGGYTLDAVLCEYEQELLERDVNLPDVKDTRGGD